MKIKIKYRSNRKCHPVSRKRTEKKPNLIRPDLAEIGEAVSNEAANIFKQAIDASVQQLTQEDAAFASQTDVNNPELADDLLGLLDATGIGPEEEQMLANQPPLLLQITPPSLPEASSQNQSGLVPNIPTNSTVPFNPQPFNFLIQSNNAGESDDLDEEDEPVQTQIPPQTQPNMVKERLVIARFQLPQFKLGFLNIGKPIKIPAKRKTFQIGPIGKTLRLNGISRSFGTRFGRITLSIPGISQTFSLGPYRRTFQIGPINKEIPTSIPIIEVADSTQVLYVDISYPSLFQNLDVKQIINECFNDAKDAAIQQLLFYVAFASSSGGASVLAGIQQSFVTFQTTFTDCLKNKVRDLSVDIAGPGLDTETLGQFRPFYLYGK